MRLMNLHAGERLGWVIKFIELIIQEFRTADLDEVRLIVMYDIACQLDTFVHNKSHGNKEVAKRIEVVVNKFHGYAHEYRCHERWGANQKVGIGNSDGEGVERLWSFLRALIVAGYVTEASCPTLYLKLTILFTQIAKPRRLRIDDCSSVSSVFGLQQ